MKIFLKYINHINIKRIFIVFFLLCLFIFLSAISYVNTVSANISDSVFRLHVIANSNNVEDQELKYKVRDRLLEYMNSLSKNCHSKEEVIQLAKENQDKLHNIAREVIINNGYTYDVTVKIGSFDFPTKNYGDISLPAGNYDALRVEIGESNGQNWWCVMFPPLCFVDVTSGVVPDDSKDIMKDNLSDESYSIISNDNPEVKFKFSIIELFQNLKIANKWAIESKYCNLNYFMIYNKDRVLI